MQHQIWDLYINYTHRRNFWTYPICAYFLKITYWHYRYHEWVCSDFEGTRSLFVTSCWCHELKAILDNYQFTPVIRDWSLDTLFCTDHPSFNHSPFLISCSCIPEIYRSWTPHSSLSWRNRMVRSYDLNAHEWRYHIYYDAWSYDLKCPLKPILHHYILIVQF